MHRSKQGVYCSLNNQGVLKRFPAQSGSVADLTAALEACEAFCEASAACNACSVENQRIEERIEGYAVAPTKWPAPQHLFSTPQPGTVEVNLYYHEQQLDHWTTWGAKQANNATAAGFVRLGWLGYAPGAAER